MTLSPGLVNWLEQLTEFKETFSYIYKFIKRYDKGYRWATGWRDTYGKVWGGWGMELGCNHPPYVDALINLEALRKPYYWDFIEASPSRQDQSLSTFPATLTSLEDGERGWKFQQLIMVWSF